MALLDLAFDLIDDAYALLSFSGRSIDYIVPHVTLEESHGDEMAITIHPTEGGGSISDHCFKLPKQLQMKVAWSDSTTGSEGYCIEVYEELLALQDEKEPFDISTGKRLYENMLMRSISVVNDAKTENIILVQCSFQEVIIVETSEGAPQADQLMPEKTAAPVDTGTKSPVAISAPPANLSIPGSTAILPGGVLF